MTYTMNRKSFEYSKILVNFGIRFESHHSSQQFSYLSQIPGTMANSTMQATFCDKASCNNHMAEWTSSDATQISILSTLLFTAFAML